MIERGTRRVAAWAVALAMGMGGVLALALPTQAQPLADHTPGDAVVYIGWAGALGAGEPYAQSRLKAVLDATRLPETIEQSLPRLMDQVTQQAGGDENEPVWPMIATIAQATWRHPTALFVSGRLHTDEFGDVSPQMAIVWRAGDRTDALRQQLAAAIERADAPDAPPLRLIAQDELTVLAIAYGDDEPVLAAAVAQSLQEQPAFTQTRQQVAVAHPMVTAYANMQALWSLIDAGLQAQGDASGLDSWRTGRRVFGLDGLQRLVWTAGFDGQDWTARAFVAAPAPRQGLLSLIDQAPLEEADLRLVPRTATWLTAGRFDAARLLPTLRPILGEVDPEALAQMEQNLADLAEQTGLDIEADLLAALGPTWLMYSDPAVAGFGGLGVCLVNRLRDVERAEQTLMHLQNMANQLMRDQEAGMRFQTMQQGDMRIHSLSFPMLSPSWAVADGNLYVALFPQAIATVSFYAKDPNNTILNNEKFQAIRQRLGAVDPMTIKFADLPLTAPATYQMYLMMSQFVTSMLAMQGGEGPVMLLPPLGAILPHLTPAGSTTWTDDTGLHLRAVTPFPGANMLSPEGLTSGAVGPLTIGTLLPAMGAARTTARQMQSNTQARGIHQGMVIRAQAHLGRLADDIAVLYEENFFTAEYVVAPTSGKQLPRDFEQWPMPQRKQWIRQHASYILVPNLKDDVDTNKIAVFLRPDDGHRGGISVVYNDNHVVWERDLDDVRRRLQEQTGMTMEQLIQRQERLGE